MYREGKYEELNHFKETDSNAEVEDMTTEQYCSIFCRIYNERLSK